MRQACEELSDNHARGAIQEPPANARHLAANPGFVGVMDCSFSVWQWTKRDAALAMAKSERAFSGPCKRHRLRWLGIGKFYFGTVTPFDRTDANRHLGTEMSIGDFFDPVATGDHGGKGRGIEKHIPDPLRFRRNHRLTLPAQLSVVAALRFHRLTPARGR